MSYRFNSCSVKEDDKEGKLKCRLAGFNPTSGGHSAFAKVTNNVLTVTANMENKKYELKVNEIGVTDDAVNTKPEKDVIKVVVRKPSKEYSLASKMPK